MNMLLLTQPRVVNQRLYKKTIDAKLLSKTHGNLVLKQQLNAKQSRLANAASDSSYPGTWSQTMLESVYK